ncbi:hypothetical protein FACS1894184_13150 [Clostridia bacterium]|nr:hypothetical protein FACS1894184_13150 [Clostridia bacterium]
MKEPKNATKANGAIIQRMDELLREQCKLQQDLAEFVGISPNAYKRWKNGESASYLRSIDKIAEFFGVTPDYLLCLQEQPYNDDVLTKREIDMIHDFRELNYDEQEYVIKGIGYLKVLQGQLQVNQAPDVKF